MEDAKQEGIAGAGSQDFSAIKQSIADNKAIAASPLDKEKGTLANPAPSSSGMVGGSGKHVGRRSRLGAMVSYSLSSKDVEAINRRRDQANASRAQHSATANGTMIHVGSKVSEGETYPMLIVREWPNLPNVNGKVFLDGNDELWVQSVSEGPNPGQFLG